MVTQDALTVRTAGEDGNNAVHDERRGRKAPHRHFEQAFRRVGLGCGGTAGIDRYVALPDGFASGRVKTIECPLGAQSVDPPAVEGRSAPRTGAGNGLGETGVVQMDPALRAGRRIVANDSFLLPALLLRVESSRDHGEGGPAGTDALTPDLARRLRSPVRRNANAKKAAVSRRAAETGPISGLQRHGSGCRDGAGRLAGGGFGEELLLGRGLPAWPQVHREA